MIVALVTSDMIPGKAFILFSVCFAHCGDFLCDNCTKKVGRPKGGGGNEKKWRLNV